MNARQSPACFESFYYILVFPPFYFCNVFFSRIFLVFFSHRCFLGRRLINSPVASFISDSIICMYIGLLNPRHSFSRNFFSNSHYRLKKARSCDIKRYHGRSRKSIIQFVKKKKSFVSGTITRWYVTHQLRLIHTSLI